MIEQKGQLIGQELDLEQNTDEWYKARLGRLTASRIGSLFTQPKLKAARLAGELSETAKTYIAEVVTERIHGKRVAKDLDSLPVINYGNVHEPHAVEWYEAYFDTQTQACGFFELGEWLGASPDRLIGESGIFEAKCAYSKIEHTKRLLRISNSADLLAYNKMYWYQVQFQMHVTGRDWAHWVSYDPDLIVHDTYAARAMLVVEMELDTAIDFSEKTEAAISYAKELLEYYKNISTPALIHNNQ